MYRLLNTKRKNVMQYVRSYTLTGGSGSRLQMLDGAASKSVIGISALQWQLGGGGGTRAVYSQIVQNSMRNMPALTQSG